MLTRDGADGASAACPRHQQHQQRVVVPPHNVVVYVAGEGGGQAGPGGAQGPQRPMITPHPVKPTNPHMVNGFRVANPLHHQQQQPGYSMPMTDSLQQQQQQQFLMNKMNGLDGTNNCFPSSQAPQQMMNNQIVTNNSCNNTTMMNNNNMVVARPRTSSRCDSVRSETAESSCSSLSSDSQTEHTQQQHHQQQQQTNNQFSNSQQYQVNVMNNPQYMNNHMQTMNPNSYNSYPNYMACQSPGGSNPSGMNQTGVYNNQNIVQAFHQVNTVQHVQMQGGQLQIMQQQYQYVQGQNMNVMQQAPGVSVNNVQRPCMMQAGGVVQGQGTNAMHGQVMQGQNNCAHNVNMMQGQGMNMVAGQPGMNTMQGQNMNMMQGQPMNVAQQQGGNANMMSGQYHAGHGQGLMGQGNLVMGGQNSGHCTGVMGVQNHHPQQHMMSGAMIPDHQQQAVMMQGNMTMVPVGAKMAGTNMNHASMMGCSGAPVGVVNSPCSGLPAGAPTVHAAVDKNFMPLIVPFGWRRVANNGQVVYTRIFCFMYKSSVSIDLPRILANRQVSREKRSLGSNSSSNVKSVEKLLVYQE
ncbi:putative nuclear receptor coactivator 6-like 2 [Homarus americanus]|uniref:Putative nuclear receptor coactivator 6-like 2 n=1 Tax=Homarus americanus TaxID=6706 RepID=A0A8J5JNE2_HOMAM|nr:putative nuclear receptor coactivator 6-like 2 [Homarus americanus]